MERIKKCKKCGIPHFLPKGMIWYPNGVTADAKNLPFILLGAEEIEYIFKGIEKKIGVSIDRLVMESKALVTIRYIDEHTPKLSKLIMKLAKKSEPLMKKIMEKMNKRMEAQMAIIAWGVVKPEDLKVEKEKIAGIVKNPVYLPIMVGGLIGGFVYFLGWPSAKADWKMEDNILKFTATPLPQESGLKKYIPRIRLLPKLNYLPGKISYHFCPECGFPEEVSEIFEWDIERGQILEKRTGKRYFMMTAHCLNSILNTLIGELGEEVSKIINDLEKEYVRESFKEKEKDYQSLLRILPIRGLGYPAKIAKEGEKLEIQINNCCDIPYLAGMIGGFYETIEGKEAKVSWAKGKEEFVGIITIVPKI